MASIPFLKWAWAACLSAGVDTCFVIAWIRCRRSVAIRRPRQLIWNVPLAIGLSLVVLVPTALQMVQQAQGLSFEQALGNLGISMNMLSYGRATIAVCLGAVLALSNGEQSSSSSREQDESEQEAGAQLSNVNMLRTNRAGAQNGVAQRIEQVLKMDPNSSDSQVAKRLQMSRNTVAKYRKQLKIEQVV